MLLKNPHSYPHMGGGYVYLFIYLLIYIRVRGFPERDILSLRLLVLGSGTDEVHCPCVNPLEA